MAEKREAEICGIMRESLKQIPGLSTSDFGNLGYMLKENPMSAFEKLKQLGYKFIMDTKFEMDIDTHTNTEYVTIELCKIVNTSRVRFATKFIIGDENNVE